MTNIASAKPYKGTFSDTMHKYSNDLRDGDDRDDGGGGGPGAPAPSCGILW